MSEKKGILKFDKYSLLEAASPFIGFAAAIVILFVIVILVGESPARALSAIIRFSMGNTGRLMTVFSIAIPLFISGLAVSFAFRAGVFNIGANGQYLVGGMVGAIAGIYLDLPSFIHIPVVVLASMLGGALWAAIPAIMKVKKGVHEVITTIMFNNIALALVNYMVNGPLLGVEGGSSLEPQTAQIHESALFGKLNYLFRGAPASDPAFRWGPALIMNAIVLAGLFFLFKKILALFNITGKKKEEKTEKQKSGLFAWVSKNREYLIAGLLSIVAIRIVHFIIQTVSLNIPEHVYLDYSLIIAIIMGTFVWFFLFKLRFGFEVRSVGTAIDVSKYSGMNVKRIQLGAFLFSGALAGLIGTQEIFAIRGFYTYQLAANLGFDGIAIALIGRNSPIGVVFSSILFAFLKQAGYGMQLYTSVPNSVIYVITGLMIIFIVVTNEILTRYIRALRKKEAQ
ncbi:MAG: ABC transporter permease [Spirochaetia bacterium]